MRGGNSEGEKVNTLFFLNVFLAGMCRKEPEMIGMTPTSFASLTS